MIRGLTWLVLAQLAGEVVVTLTHAPVPGPVVGMVFLLAALVLGDAFWGAGRVEGEVAPVADGLLRHLQLFFVPAGVGIIVYLSTLRDQALPIVAALVVSWLVVLVLVALVVQAMVRRRPPGAVAGPADSPGPTGPGEGA